MGQKNTDFSAIPLAQRITGAVTTDLAKRPWIGERLLGPGQWRRNLDVRVG